MSGTRHGQGQFLEAFQVEVEGLARMGEGNRERIAARDDVREVGEIDQIGGILCSICDCEYILSINMSCRHESVARRMRWLSAG